jgi:hypothetical protein
MNNSSSPNTSRAPQNGDGSQALDEQHADGTESETNLRHEDSTATREEGRRILDGFMSVTPYLDAVIGRSFVMAVSGEFHYRNDPDRVLLDEIQQRARERDPDYHSFRDTYRDGHGIRTLYSYQSKNAALYQTLPTGERVRTVDYLMPAEMTAGGLEVASDHKTAMYKVIQTGKPQSSVVPAHVLGAPLLSHAFPVFSSSGVLIGGVSFAVELTDIVAMAERLNHIVSQNDAARLEALAHKLSEEVRAASSAADELRHEAERSRRSADTIRNKSTRVIDSSEELNVLAINTAIEASKLTDERTGFGVIARKMKEIAMDTQTSLAEIDAESAGQQKVSAGVHDHSQSLSAISGRLGDALSLLFEVSRKIEREQEELEALVRSSIERITDGGEELQAIYALIRSSDSSS